MEANELTKLKKRLSKIGIEIDLVGNIPWIYLRSVNGNIIKREDYTSNHGFNIAWYPIKPGKKVSLAEDPKVIIALIRKLLITN